MHRISSAEANTRLRLRDTLRAAGLRCTEQRLAVLRELEQAGSPLSHREMLDRLAPFKWDAATTFRNLNDLCDYGLVSRIDVGDHVWRFELQSGTRKRNGRHPHFLCVECGTVTCLHEVSIADATQQLPVPGSAKSVDEVLLKGRCERCAGSE